MRRRVVLLLAGLLTVGAAAGVADGLLRTPPGSTAPIDDNHPVPVQPIVDPVRP